MKLAVRGIASDEVRRDSRGRRRRQRPAGARSHRRGVGESLPALSRADRARRRELVLAYRPFATVQPYAETGPIFLHKQPCGRYASDALPAWFVYMDPAIIRGYDGDDWIRYETGASSRGRT